MSARLLEDTLELLSRQELIDASTAAFPGTWARPQNFDHAGRKCGKRGAYSRPGGYSSLCYVGDVTKEMVDQYRRERKEITWPGTGSAEIIRYYW